jgi:flagellar basal body-associated protein FliL
VKPQEDYPYSKRVRQVGRKRGIALALPLLKEIKGQYNPLMESFANPFIQIMFVLTMVVISLAGISIRIQKGNKLQKKSIEQSQVKADAQYSEFGIFRQGDRTVIKCPSCAEFISLEAKICKNCQSNVEKHVADLIKKMKEFDANQYREAEVRKIELAKARAESSKKFKKNLPKFILIVLVVIGILVGNTWALNVMSTKKDSNNESKWLIESKNEYLKAITKLAD